MPLKGIIFLVLLVFQASSLVLAAELQRIETQESNNFRLTRSYQRMLLPESIETEPYASIRQYAGLKLENRLRDELDNILEIAAWAHKRWRHDPFGMGPVTALEILRAAEQGERFSCNEYSIVLRDVLRAYGYVSRRATLQSPEIAYGGLGSAHVAVEVYSSHLDKWILLDPQWGLYPEHQGEPINVHEYYLLKQQGREHEVRFQPFTRNLLSKPAADAVEYQKFINQYLGYLSVDLLADEERVHVLLALEGRSWPLTFQGLPRSAQIFTRTPQDVYFDVNRVSLVLNYRHDAQPLSKQSIEFNDEQDYAGKMYQFAAVPDFEVGPHHSMPWFSRFEYRLNMGKWESLEGESFPWRLANGKNRLEVRGVNQQNRRGAITYIDIYYGI